MVGGQGKFVAPAGGGAIDRAQVALAGIVAGIFYGVAGFVGKFAEIDLMAMGGTS